MREMITERQELDDRQLDISGLLGPDDMIVFMVL